MTREDEFKCIKLKLIIKKMKKIILLALTALMMAGCDTRTEEQRYNDYLQEQNKVKRQIEYQNRWKGYSVIIVDNCEYIVKKIDVSKGLSGYLAHKGNCRFCAERRKQELKELVEQLKEK